MHPKLISDGTCQKGDFLFHVSVGMSVASGDESKLFVDFDECINQLGIEMPTTNTENGSPRFFMQHTVAVDLIVAQRIVHIGHGHQARGQGNAVAQSPLRVTASIPFFVARVGSIFYRLSRWRKILRRPFGKFDGFTRERGVSLDDIKFFVSQTIRLEQNPIWDADLADVIHGYRLK